MSKRVKSRPRASQVDMAQKALAEYEEMECRRYHERIRAQKGAPMEITQEDVERVTAMAIMDEVDRQHAELFRTSRCPACETIATWENVEKHPQHEMLNALSGQEASGYKQWTSNHEPDCSFMVAYAQVDALAAHYHIVRAFKQYDMPRPDGKVTRDLLPVRVPALGDPPVPPWPGEETPESAE